MDRRSFIRAGALGLAAAAAGDTALGLSARALAGATPAQSRPDVAVVQGLDYFRNAVRAVDMLGGMGKFVSRGTTVGLLINSPFRNFGAHTNPDVVLAVVRMCLEAGAGAVIPLKGESGRYFKQSGLAQEMARELETLKEPRRGRVRVDIPKGLVLKKAEISRDLLECDVYISLPVTKHHEGTEYTGALKNLMGAAPYSTNKFFHQGRKGPGRYDDVEHLSQCIADLNLVRTPDLAVCDSTKFLTSNGPWGPGRMLAPHKVAASADAVALDAFGCTLLGRKPRETRMIVMARDHGLSRVDLDNLRIEEAKI